MQEEIWIANDHGGYQAKLDVLTWLKKQNWDVIDCGCDSEEIVRYPYYAAHVAKAVSEKRISLGILICSTGVGMSITANKYPGVRAALCMDSYMAKMTRLHNNSNVLCLGGKILGIMKIRDIIDTWLTTEYMGERHKISLDLISDIEVKQINNSLWTGEDLKEYPFREFSKYYNDQKQLI